MVAKNIKEWSYSKLPNDDIPEPYPSNHRIEVSAQDEDNTIKIDGVILDGDSSTVVSPIVFLADNELTVTFQEQSIGQSEGIVFAIEQFVHFELEVTFQDALPNSVIGSYTQLNGSVEELFETDITG